LKIEELLLTDEEMDKAYCLADLHTDKLGHDAIAQAQLRKLADMGVGRMVERGELKECISFQANGSPFKFWSKEKVFQSLKEEMEASNE
jgi:hypothetical protein